MSAASGTIFTFAQGVLRAGATAATEATIASPGNFVALEINIGLLGVAVKVTGDYVGVISVQVSLDHTLTYIEIDTIDSEQLTKIYTFPQNGPLLFTDFRVAGKTWTSGNAQIEIDPWNPLAVVTWEVSHGVPQPQHAPDTFHSIAATALGNTMVWTPAAGKIFRLLRVWIRPSNDSFFLTVPQNLIVDLRDNTTTLGLATSFYLPKNLPASPPEYTPFVQDLGPNGYLGQAPGSVLNVNLSAALNGGQIRVIAMGTEE